MTVISPFLTFPNISWWIQIMNAGTIILDAGEHFQKMTGRNRYDIAGANNAIKLSVPLASGREQRVPMGRLQIFNGDKWQVQHWRSLVSVYNRSPFFEHYAHTLEPLFTTEYTLLTDFNRATIDWTARQLKIRPQLQETTEYVKQYDESVRDLRKFKQDKTLPVRYHQVFEDRLGFLPDLSILDLLFSEGPAALSYLKTLN